MMKFELRGMMLAVAGMQFIFSHGYAQEKSREYDVSGHVKASSSGESLPYANVLLKGTKQGTTTNTDGYFVLVNVPAGLCTLAVRYIGYASREVEVRVGPGRAAPLLIELDQTVLKGEQVTVTAQAQMLDVSSKEVGQVTFSPRQLSALPSIGETDIFRAMQLLPGVSAVSEGQSGLYVRGGTPDQNLILFDGMTIYHVDHFFGFFSAFNADAVKDVQFYKGGFPAQYGGRVSSVIDMTGKTGDSKRTRLGFGANLLSAHTGIELPLWNRGTLLFTLRRSYTDFIRSPLYNSIYKLMTGGDDGGAAGGPVRGMRGGGPGGAMNSEAGEFRPKFYFYDLNGKATVNASAGDVLSLSVYSGKDNLDKSQDFSDMAFQMRGDGSDVSLKTADITQWGNLGYSGKWSRQWHNRLHTDFLAARSAYFSDYDRSNNLSSPTLSVRDSSGVRRDFSNASKEINRVKDAGLKLDADWQAFASHRIGFGAAVSRFNSEFTASRNDSIPIFDRRNEAVQAAFYLQDRWRAGALELTAGLRGTYYEGTRKSYYEPRTAAQIEILSGLKLKGAWGNYYQFVNRITNEDVTQGARDFWLLTDSATPPVFAEHRILGLGYENASYAFSIEAYRKSMENLVEFSRRFRGPEGRESFLFTGKGEAKGIEFFAQKKRGALTGWAGYTLSKAENRFPLINDGAAFPASQDRRHEIHIVSRYTLGVWNFSATWVFATGGAYTSPESQYTLTLIDGQTLNYIHISGKNANRLPDYHRLDLSVSRSFESERWATELGLSVFNLYNRKNVWYRDYGLDTVPVTVTNVLYLGITPTVFAQFNLK
jgi:ferric enterobactin receptor